MGKSEHERAAPLARPKACGNRIATMLPDGTMKQRFLVAALLTCAAWTASGSQAAYAVPGGEIGTLPTGRYECERPGDISGSARIRIPEEDFRIITGSNYVSAGKRGSYLLTGDRIVMTGGPLEGRKYHRTSSRYLRIQNADGTDSDRRCILALATMR